MNFVGELGWELHHPLAHQASLYEALVQAGQRSSLCHFGLRAMDSMRLEKGYPMWGQDLSLEFSALSSGLEPFLKPTKGDFEGREAIVAEQARGCTQRLVLLEVEPGAADAIGNEPVYLKESIVGQTSSGGFGYRTGKSLALAYVRADAAVPGTALCVEILGEPRQAVVTPGCVYDPSGKKMRADARELNPAA